MGVGDALGSCVTRMKVGKETGAGVGTQAESARVKMSRAMRVERVMG